MGGSPEDGRHFFETETAKWKKVIHNANIHAD
jgi:hypothetical protein